MHRIVCRVCPSKRVIAMRCAFFPFISLDLFFNLIAWDFSSIMMHSCIRCTSHAPHKMDWTQHNSAKTKKVTLAHTHTWMHEIERNAEKIKCNFIFRLFSLMPLCRLFVHLHMPFVWLCAVCVYTEHIIYLFALVRFSSSSFVHLFSAAFYLVYYKFVVNFVFSLFADMKYECDMHTTLTHIRTDQPANASIAMLLSSAVVDIRIIHGN